MSSFSEVGYTRSWEVSVTRKNAWYKYKKDECSSHAAVVALRRILSTVTADDRKLHRHAAHTR